MKAPLEQWLSDGLANCGVDARLVESEWSDLCQHDVVTFADANLPPSSLPALAAFSLEFSSQFVFATDELQTAFERAVWDDPKMVELRGIYQNQTQQHLELLGLSDFPRFDPGTETLKAFAARVEAICGFASGQMLMVDRYDRIVLAPTRPQDLTVDDVSKLMALLNHAAPDTVFTVMAEDSSI